MFVSNNSSSAKRGISTLKLMFRNTPSTKPLNAVGLIQFGVCSLQMDSSATSLVPSIDCRRQRTVGVAPAFAEAYSLLYDSFSSCASRNTMVGLSSGECFQPTTNFYLWSWEVKMWNSYMCLSPTTSLSRTSEWSTLSIVALFELNECLVSFERPFDSSRTKKRFHCLARS